jgi:VWFA-related protein
MRTLLVALLSFGLTPAFAQVQSVPQPTEDAGGYTLKVKSRLVDVSAVVNRNGVPVRNLERKDFKLYEDGKLRPIRYFDADNNLPLTVGLLLDTSLSQRSYFDEQRIASRKFLTELLTRPQDRAFVERFDYRVQLLHPLTSNVNSLNGSLQFLTSAYEAKGPGTLIWDAIAATASQILSHASATEGRRAIIILTDGEDVGSKLDLAHAISVAQLYDMSVYSILYTSKKVGTLTKLDPQIRPRMGAAKGPASMEVLSDETGGRTFEVDSSGADSGNTIDEIFATIAEDLRSGYRIGFTPAKSAPLSRHTLQLKVDGRHLDAQMRDSYFTPKE